MERIIDEKRNKIIFYKRKTGSFIITISLAKKWLNFIGITDENREIYFLLTKDNILITKNLSNYNYLDFKKKLISFTQNSIKTSLSKEWLETLGIDEVNNTCILELRKDSITILNDDGRNIF
ncbi:hypothetical protein [Clostridium baratii]|uniref:Uncharacterized protein n=1 Tax=Clostridium baratii TaxID=1561 RepID=A0A174VEN0_9CLOT|nr:hypothetical protein [Clostridium baratii]CUQ30475.1 Uncharacterised protein [Clostridium baratii]